MRRCGGATRQQAMTNVQPGPAHPPGSSCCGRCSTRRRRRRRRSRRCHRHCSCEAHCGAGRSSVSGGNCQIWLSLDTGAASNRRQKGAEAHPGVAAQKASHSATVAVCGELSRVEHRRNVQDQHRGLVREAGLSGPGLAQSACGIRRRSAQRHALPPHSRSAPSRVSSQPPPLSSRGLARGAGALNAVQDALQGCGGAAAGRAFGEL